LTDLFQIYCEIMGWLWYI